MSLRIFLEETKVHSTESNILKIYLNTYRNQWFMCSFIWKIYPSVVYPIETASKHCSRKQYKTLKIDVTKDWTVWRGKLGKQNFQICALVNITYIKLLRVIDTQSMVWTSWKGITRELVKMQNLSFHPGPTEPVSAF